MLESNIFLYTIRWINRVVSIFIFCICTWIIVSPIAPEINYAASHFFKNKSSSINTQSKLEELAKNNNQNTNQNTTGTDKINEKVDLDNLLLENNIYIPSIDLVAPVKELRSIEDLHTGSWRRPETSTPDKGGNTVIIAHRYTRKNGESGPNTFYHLPKVQIGEKIFVSYEKKMYEYEAIEIKVVEPEDVYIEDATTTANILTLYTCTPLWTSSQRHVVVAKLISPKI